MVVLVLLLYLIVSSARTDHVPSVVISVGPVYQLCSNGSLFSKTLIPSIAASGMYVVFEAANPAEARNG